MRKPFKKGDVITRIKKTEIGSVTLGKSYTAVENEDRHGGVIIIDDFGDRGNYTAEYFELSKHNIVKQIINDL